MHRTLIYIRITSHHDHHSPCCHCSRNPTPYHHSYTISYHSSYTPHSHHPYPRDPYIPCTADPYLHHPRDPSTSYTIPYYTPHYTTPHIHYTPHYDISHYTTPHTHTSACVHVCADACVGFCLFGYEIDCDGVFFCGCVGTPPPLTRVCGEVSCVFDGTVV